MTSTCFVAQKKHFPPSFRFVLIVNMKKLTLMIESKLPHDQSRLA